MENVNDLAGAPAKSSWLAVWAMALGVVSLTSAEFLPVSLLTPIAHDLNIVEGAAGQTITAASLAALISSLLTAFLGGWLDRRTVLLILSANQVAANIIFASAPSLPVLLLGRVMLGVSVGGFWALSAALAMRLVTPDDVPKALSIIFGGVSVATVAAAPIGSYLGGLLGWRGVFWGAGGLGTLAFALQFATLPPMPTTKAARLGTLFNVLKRPKIGEGNLYVVLCFAAHFAFFTYLRGFLESVTGLDVTGVSGVLMTFGAGNVVGTALAGTMMRRGPLTPLVAVTFLMAMLTIGLALFGHSTFAMFVIVTLWGFAFGVFPVGWSTWVTQSVADELETAGGIFVAAAQTAITFGAAVGGGLLEAFGPYGPVSASGILAASVSLLIWLRLKQ